MKSWILLVALSASCLVGCEKKDQTPPTPTTPPTTPKPTPTAADAAPAIPKVLPATPEAAAPNPTPAAQTSADQTAPAVPATPAPPADTAQATSDANSAAQASAVDTQSKAQSLLTQFMDYIKQNKLDDAQGAMTKLQGLEAKLPASWQAKIKSAQDALSAAKAGNNFKNALPGGLGK
jgi:hypothetical protein